MIVMKFGGSSVESASAIQRVASIVSTRLERQPIVVVSAMGKTTNKLLSMAACAVNGRRAEALEAMEELKRFHLNEAPHAADAIAGRFLELEEILKGVAALGELTPRTIDLISSYGERLSSLIVTDVFRTLGMDAMHLDSRSVIITDRRHTQAAPLFTETYPRLAATITPLAQSNKVVVMGGFIGSTLDGVTTTLGRGGSDFTASIVGAGVGAEEIQIWTDVDGMLTCDPTILTGGHRVKTISFAEAAESAYFGAKVLHPATVVPAVERNIPVLILNSRRPDSPGTRVIADRVPCRNVVKSIACKRDITIINVTSTRMLMAYGFLRRMFEVFDRYETPVDMLATSEVSVSLTIDNPKNLPRIVEELSQFSQVTVESDLAIICLVGDSIHDTPGVAGRIFTALKNINIRMISQGASRLNLGFVVSADDLRDAVSRLHAELFSDLDPDVFE